MQSDGQYSNTVTAANLSLMELLAYTGNLHRSTESDKVAEESYGMTKHIDKDQECNIIGNFEGFYVPSLVETLTKLRCVYTIYSTSFALGFWNQARLEALNKVSSHCNHILTDHTDQKALPGL